MAGREAVVVDISIRVFTCCVDNIPCVDFFTSKEKSVIINDFDNHLPDVSYFTLLFARLLILASLIFGHQMPRLHHKFPSSSVNISAPRPFLRAILSARCDFLSASNLSPISRSLVFFTHLPRIRQ